MSSGLAATETSLFVYDQDLFRNLTASNIIFEPFRVMIANRLSINGSDWENTFGKHNRLVNVNDVYFTCYSVTNIRWKMFKNSYATKNIVI